MAESPNSPGLDELNRALPGTPSPPTPNASDAGARKTNRLAAAGAAAKEGALVDSGPAGGLLFKEVNELRKASAAEDKVDRAVEKAEKYTNTIFGRVAQNKYFEGTTFFFITLNALYIGYDADYTARFGKPDNPYSSEMPWGFIMMENLFAVYFTLEVIIRFIAYKVKVSCIWDGWFVFDFILVSFMVLETWIFPAFGLAGPLAQFSVLRLLRLLRISRMARLMKQCPELMIIIKGLMASFRSVGCTAILLLLVLYIWSILFTTEFHEGARTDDELGDTIHYHFGTMGRSMFCLFIMGTVLDDVTVATNAIRATKNWFMLGLFFVFILISSFTILNMLIGILCEVVSATAAGEHAKAMETTVREALQSIFTLLDSDGSGHVTKEEFVKMGMDPRVVTALAEMEVNQNHFRKYCEILFKEGDGNESIDFDTLIGMILRLRPGNHISALDFSLLEAALDKGQDKVRSRIVRIKKKLKALAEKGDANDKNGAFAKPALRCEDTGSVEPPAMAKGEDPPLPPNVSKSGYPLEMFANVSSTQITQELERRLGVSMKDYDPTCQKA